MTALDALIYLDSRDGLGGWLLAGRDTSSFSSADASGSTSQAANIQEALELGASCLILDEDVCATNFMIRDMCSLLIHALYICALPWIALHAQMNVPRHSSEQPATA